MFFIILKIIVTVSAVLGLSLVAERVGPKAAGLLSGYPMGAAIVLFFYGLEISPEFASESAIYTLVGLIATQSFMYFYYRASLYFRRLNMLCSTVVSLSGFFLIAWLLHFVALDKLSALLTVTLSLFVFMRLFKRIENTTIAHRITLTYTIILARAILAASLILIVIGVAKLVGPTWAGLFSAFPATFLPLILIVQFTYDKEHVHTIIKNVPRGLGAVIIYALAVSFVYPTFGVYIGTVLAFIAATIYMAAYLFLSGRIRE
jgi:hypothetical protein